MLASERMESLGAMGALGDALNSDNASASVYDMRVRPAQVGPPCGGVRTAMQRTLIGRALTLQIRRISGGPSLPPLQPRMAPSTLRPRAVAHPHRPDRGVRDRVHERGAASDSGYHPGGRSPTPAAPARVRRRCAPVPP